MKYFSSLLILLIIFLLSNCADKIKHADLVLLNGNIITVDSNNTIVEAIAVIDDKIVSLGSSDEIINLVGDSTDVIDLKGKTAIPGFIDSHAHLISTGQAKITLNLRDAKNWDEVVYLVAAAADESRNGEWIIGRGWHQEKWNPSPIENINGYPLHNKLSEATPRNPVMLSHASGHAIFANAKAMEIANVTSETTDPRGGKIVKDKEGNPIGVFMEEAEQLISSHYQKYLDERTLEEQKNEKKKQLLWLLMNAYQMGLLLFMMQELLLKIFGY
jgi:predicted amidohydrolase YtcJ